EDIKPRVADFNGEVFLITTPDENNPDSSEFILWLMDQAGEKNSEFAVISWSTEDNPFMGERSIEIMTSGMSEAKKMQILHGKIVRSSVRYFPYKKIDHIFDEERVDYKMIDFIN